MTTSYYINHNCTFMYCYNTIEEFCLINYEWNKCDRQELQELLIQLYVAIILLHCIHLEHTTVPPSEMTTTTTLDIIHPPGFYLKYNITKT
jgi:hypothetical protein